MGAALKITDRGYRYRANQAIPEHPKVCVFCGSSREKLMVAHLDGHEENTEENNLSWSCRSCNSLSSNTLRNAGKGRLTRQFNPSRGARNVGEWMQAVGAITPHIYRGDRGISSTMPVSEAVAIIRATPHARRSQFASELRKYKSSRSRERGNPARRKNSWTGEEDDLIQHARTSREPEELASLFLYGESQGDSGLMDAVRGRVRSLGLKRSDFQFNPAKFDRCVKEVQRRGGGAVNAYAVCTAAGTRDPGKKRNAMSRSDKKVLKDFQRYGSTIATYSIPGLWEGLTLADAFKNPVQKKNPSGEAQQVYQEFHGEPPSETVIVEKKVHFHKHLASAGELRKLEVRRRVDRGVTTLTRFKGALLAFNEAKNQLFVEGGDQTVSLEAFGIDRNEAHEMETLGQVLSIDYFTNKTHLGEEGGEATYEHGFRMTNENGKHVTVKIARYPDLIYSVPNEQLYFSGGSYLIRAEGIDQ